MPQCPQCAAALKDDYGMMTCPSCGVILFIDMEGVAHVGTDDGPSSPAAEAIPEAMSDVGVQQPSMDFDPLGAEYESQLASSAGEFPSSEILATETPVDTPAFESLADGSSDFSMDQFLGYGAPSEHSSNEAAPPVPVSPNDPLGLGGYANSELSSAKDGPFVFRIFISGIDAKEIRAEIREAIDDSRFAWETSRIMASIDKGRLVIDNVSPIKAAILISRIKRLPITVRWEQFAITQLDSFG